MTLSMTMTVAIPVRVLHRLLLPLALTGCLEGSTDLAHVDVQMLTIFIGSNAMEGELQPRRELRDPCIVLGDDFHVRVDSVELNVDPGGRDESCESPDTDGCESGTARCLSPYFDLSWPPKLATAQLVIADDSRTIGCDLGDAFAERTITRVTEGTWNATRGDQLSVRVSPASDVSRFVVDTYFPSFPSLTVPHTVSGDVLTFTVPMSLSLGAQTLRVRLSGEATASCDVPSLSSYEYFIHQDINVL